MPAENVAITSHPTVGDVRIGEVFHCWGSQQGQNAQNWLLSIIPRIGMTCRAAPTVPSKG